MTTTEQSNAGLASFGEMSDAEFRSRRLRSTIGAGLMNAGVAFSMAMGFTVAPGSAALGVSTAQYLLYYSLFTLSIAVVSTFAGALTRRFGITRVTRVAAVVACAGFSTLAVAPNIGVLYLGAVVSGAGYAFCATMAVVVIVNGWHDHERKGTVLGLVASCVGLGGILAGFIVPPIVEMAGWRSAFGVVALASLVFVLLPSLVLISDPPNQRGTSAAPKPKAVLLLNGVFGITVVVMLAGMLLSLDSAVTQLFAPVYDSKGLTLSEAGLLIAAWSALNIFAKPVLGFLIDRFGVWWGAVIVAVCFAVGFPLLAAMDSVLAIIAILPLLTAGIAANNVLLPAVVSRAVGQIRFDAVYGLVISGVYLGLAVGTPIWGLVYDITGTYDAALLGAGLAGALAAGCMMLALALSRVRRNEADSRSTRPEALQATTTEDLRSEPV